MKYVLIFLFVPSFALSQTRKDTKIIVTLADTANAFNRLALKLYENGYTVEKKDEQVKFLVTEPKSLKRWNAYLKIRAIQKGNTIVFTGEVNLPSFDNRFDQLEYMGVKGSIYRDSWALIESIAKQFGTLSYSK